MHSVSLCSNSVCLSLAISTSLILQLNDLLEFRNGEGKIRVKSYGRRMSSNKLFETEIISLSGMYLRLY